tara:strand:+ start:666 stop:776 length:111 start_codon:yes stop_codon:yes gene_type:complete
MKKNGLILGLWSYIGETLQKEGKGGKRSQRALSEGR